MTVRVYSLGGLGGSGGRAEEKAQSSSSLDAVATAAAAAAAAAGGAGAGAGLWLLVGAGFGEDAVRDERAAKGSCATAAGFGGGAKADRIDMEGCGVEEEEGGEVKEEKWEKDEPGGGVGVETGPLALLFCVTDDRRAGPGRLVLAPKPRAIPPAWP